MSQDKPIDATLQHIALLSAKRERLLVAQIEAENQFIEAASRRYRLGEIDLDVLVDLYRAFREVAAPGFGKRWNEIADVTHYEIAAYHRDKRKYGPNRPHGAWEGDFPFLCDAPMPAPRVSVVYVLFDDCSVPCYVGSTDHLRTRLKAHDRNGKRFVRWIAYPCADREAAYELESRLLREHKPYLNKANGRREAS